MASSEVGGDVLAVQRGDRDAFASLMARYQNRLYRYLLRWVHDPATAEDLFQQTWMRVIAEHPSLRRQTELRRLALCRGQEPRDRPPAPPPARQPRRARGEGPVPVGEYLQPERRGRSSSCCVPSRSERVQKALESQPPVFREILSLRFEEEMKLEEIAEVLSIPLGTVKSRLARALEHLRTAFLRLKLEEHTP